MVLLRNGCCLSVRFLKAQWYSGIFAEMDRHINQPNILIIMQAWVHLTKLDWCGVLWLLHLVKQLGPGTGSSLGNFAPAAKQKISAKKIDSGTVIYVFFSLTILN